MESVGGAGRRKALPKAARVGWLWNGTPGDSAAFLTCLQVGAPCELIRFLLARATTAGQLTTSRGDGGCSR